MKALIKVGYGCNENCTFCHTADIRHMEDTADRILWKISRAKRLGYTMVVLSGGEPTIRPELMLWARRVAQLGMDFGLVTNGLLLSYRNVVDELYEECRLRYVYMSIHGGSAKVHNSVVRADTYGKAVSALQNLAGRVPDLTANCVVTTANVKHLRSLVDRLVALPDLTIKFSMTQPKGGGANAFDVLVPEVADCADRVRDAIAYGIGIAKERDLPSIRFAHDGIPFCLLPGLEDLYDDLKTHRFATMIETDEDDFVPVDDVAKVFTPRCAPCSLKGACPGLFRGYHETRGDAALRPIVDRPRSNSYHFVPQRDIARPAGAPCPLVADGTAPYDRGRTLFLRLKDRMRLFRTETRDFADVELQSIKEELGQVYVDVSTKLAPDDFAKDLRKLRRSAECEACDKRPACTGAWEPVAGDVFTRDDAVVLDLLATLRGTVLDLGCGEGPYLTAMAAQAEKGLIAYTGVDPDEERLRVLAGRYPFARFLAKRAEDLNGEVGSVDHVLVLRSYNHLIDPAGALDGAIARLRPGGTLTVVDNVAFGLVRSRTHAARAEGAPENRFEHYRNDGAEEASSRLAGRPLRLVARRDVGPDTSNQWLLHYERLAPTEELHAAPMPQLLLGGPPPNPPAPEPRGEDLMEPQSEFADFQNDAMVTRVRAPAGASDDAEEGLIRRLSHEEAAHEKRNWVRLSYDCNNRCTFCLDTNAHDGTMRSNFDIKAQIIEGRKRGSDRLILSGGEPTMHPNFLDFVTLGRKAGYPKIQTVTNGRMFKYPEFLERAAKNGLHEVTFSLHGHNAKLHDALVGVPGAFVEETAGLKAALASGYFIINVDIVINKKNVKHLPTMLETFIGWGVQEFDLLHIIPFGNAWTEARDHLFYDLEGNLEHLQKTFAYARRPDIHIWLNRFPPPFAEGYEDLIQDPYKLNDEVRGRREEYDRYLSLGEKLSCRQPDRCSRCYLQNLCDTLDDVIAVRKEEQVDVLRVAAGTLPTAGKLPKARAERIVAANLHDASELLAQVDAFYTRPGAEPNAAPSDVELELADYAGLAASLDAEGRFAGKKLARCYTARAEDAALLFGMGGSFEIGVYLTRATEPFVRALDEAKRTRLVLVQRNYDLATDALANDVDLVAFFASRPTVAATENIPECLSGIAPRRAPALLDSGMLGSDARIDMKAYTKRYVADGYYTKALRCATCSRNPECRGVHVNWVRAHGLVSLSPIDPTRKLKTAEELEAEEAAAEAISDAAAEVTEAAAAE